MGETPVAEPEQANRPPTRWPIEVVRGVVRAMPRAVEDLFKDRCPQYAAAISYHVLFSIVPLTILLVSVFGLVLQDDALRKHVDDELIKLLPFSSEGIRKSVEQIANPWSAIGLISLIALLWGASGMMASIRLGLEATMKVERRRPVAHAKLIDFVLVGTAGVLVLLVVALSAFAAFFGRVLDKGAEHLGINANPSGLLLRDIVQLVLIFTMAYLLFRFVPTRTGLRSRDLLAGAILTAIGIWGSAKIISLAFDFSHYNVIYGSLGGVMVFLFFVYGAALIVLLGSEFAHAWAQPPGPPGPPLQAQIWSAIRGLFFYTDDDEEKRPFR
ncbi:MAG TPA: YihY/virulence factor BrkB family protein [Gaiellaceae bacterium]|nr:YihY/virulence factor BrkB family protein [Gaiellaceae bacterium]